MMARRTRVLLAAAAFALLVLAAGCRAAGTPEPSPNSPSSSELVEAPKTYDATTVTFTGEVIGEAMARGEMAWLHVNDDPYYILNVEEGAQLGGYNNGMPVWVDTRESEAITYFGDYRHEGDIVRVKGTFNSACPEHGGDMDIHATSLEIIEVGHDVVDEVTPVKVVWAVGLALLAAVLYLAERRFGRRA